ncbi:FAD-dependent oxidoreductase [Beijerinckia indica]|uniref:D-amino-acid oxidase n=1 Tax=Beijerinckia indica subsp. indica (strain ATCC 9039 / DSM 1715 / NCIMB 8712) TaxID=395963 RepID=B2IGM5_BEII9|nr:FAD-dependent oxidoreductase [Beijerinckia indica]ACB95786.1 glycine oxidase ThiO [Beijerinckia indica subsp. indica ATCC 9039]
MRIRIIGAGIMGLTTAFEFASHGADVEVVEQRDGPGKGCSFLAGGMIAPWCEVESAEPIVGTMGLEALRFWTEDVPVATRQGSLVLAPPRDRPELARFSRLTSHYERMDGAALAALEPDLEGRFGEALFFPEEAHLDPRQATAALGERLAAAPNVILRYGTEAEDLSEAGADWIIDCRGLAGRDALPDLRGVKGEMLVLRTGDIRLARPIRLLHPRFPVYIVPRGDGRFMIGATSIENEEEGRITARSMVELLSAAMTVHPAFGEAEIIETGAGLRPAFPNNLPRLRVEGHVVRANGLYRHGFLLAPPVARRIRRMVLEGASFPEVMDADPRERQRA